MVQSPVPLKDVMVSDPTRLDAVVQSSDRVFLIAKQSGQTNAFFFDEYGQQILTLEVAIGADLSASTSFWPASFRAPTFTARSPARPSC